MRKDIKDFVMQCEVCQRNKSKTLAPTGLLQPLSVLTQVWSDIFMDFIGGLPKVKGKDMIISMCLLYQCVYCNGDSTIICQRNC